MEQPPWSQQQREGAGCAAMGETETSCDADLDQSLTDLCEIDGALLMMELMEDLPASSDLLLDGDVDRQLSHVIRSLEAEIGGGADEAAVMMADDGGENRLDRIDDVLSDDMDDGFEYWHPQVSSSLAGHDEAEGWCVYTNTNGYESAGVLGYVTTVDYHQYYYDHMYLPLWE